MKKYTTKKLWEKIKQKKRINLRILCPLVKDHYDELIKITLLFILLLKKTSEKSEVLV